MTGGRRWGPTETLLRQSVAQHSQCSSEASSSELRPLRILCLDGGGVKGYNTLEMLRALQSKCGGVPISEMFDLIAGTSAGGASTIGLCQMAPDGIGLVEELLDALAGDVLPASSTCGLLCHGQKVPQAKVDEYVELVKAKMSIDDTSPLKAPTRGGADKAAVPHCFVVASAMDTESKFKEISPFVIANYSRPAGARVPPARSSQQEGSHARTQPLRTELSGPPRDALARTHG